MIKMSDILKNKGIQPVPEVNSPAAPSVPAKQEVKAPASPVEPAKVETPKAVPPQQAEPVVQPEKSKESFEKEKKLEELEKKLEKLKTDLEASAQKQASLVSDKLQEEIQQKEMLEDKLKDQEKRIAHYLKTIEETQHALEIEMRKNRMEQESRRQAETRLHDVEEKETRLVREYEKKLEKQEIVPVQEPPVTKPSDTAPKIEPKKRPSSFEETKKTTPSVPHSNDPEKAFPPSAFFSVSPTQKRGIPSSHLFEVSAKLYNEGFNLAKEIFLRVKEGKPFNLDKLTQYGEILVGQLQEDDLEMLKLTMKAVPEDNYLYSKAINAAILSLEIGIGLGHDNDFLMDLLVSGILYDVGLMSIQNSINHSKELKSDQQQQVHQHPLYMLDVLKESGVKESILNAIVQHHERPDGKGYPQGIRGEGIHEYARILQVVDALEAATHARPHKKEKSYPEAVKEIFEQSGKAYDSIVVRALMNRIGLYPIGTLVEISTGQVARVLIQNHNYPMRPIVQLEYGPKGIRLDDRQTLDLKQQPSIHIINSVKDIETFSQRTPPAHSANKTRQSKKNISFLDIMLTLLAIAIAGVLVLFLLRL